MSDSECDASVSVIAAFLNAERFLAEAVESVLAQTCAAWELLLVDDGSTDGSTAIAQRYARRYPGRIRYLEHPNHANRGVCASRNLGIRHARRNLVAILDADDVWLPHKLKEQIRLLNKHPKAAMVCGRAMYWRSWSDGDGNVDHTPELGLPGDRLYTPPALFTRCHPLGDATAPCPSDLLIRRHAVVAIGGFEEEFTGERQLYEDQAFLVKLYLHYPVYLSERTWIRYRIHPDSCMAQVDDPEQVRLYFLQWLESYVQREHIDPDVWEPALHAAFRPYRHPYLTAATRRLRGAWRRGKRVLRHVAPSN